MCPWPHPEAVDLRVPDWHKGFKSGVLFLVSWALALSRGQTSSQLKPTHNPGRLRLPSLSWFCGVQLSGTPNFLQHLPGHSVFWYMRSGFSSRFCIPYSNPCAPIHSLLPVSWSWWSQSGQTARRRHNVVFMHWPERTRSSLLRGAPAAMGPSAARFCFPNESWFVKGGGQRPEIIILL